MMLMSLSRHIWNTDLRSCSPPRRSSPSFVMDMFTKLHSLNIKF
jgi:hypothetical protein